MNATKPITRRCALCGARFEPNPRVGDHQRYCRKPECAKASHREAQSRWLKKKSNRDHFKGEENVDRVRAWRAAHPNYWRDRRARKAIDRANLDVGKKLYAVARKIALQDSIDTHFSLLVGLVSHVTGHALQDTIANEIRRLILLGHGILRRPSPPESPRP